MMAKFLSAEALDITKSQLRALHLVLDKAKAGQLVHIRMREPWKAEDDQSIPPEHFGFNMNFWTAEPDNCGTVCCLGGWAEKLGKVKFFYTQLEDNPSLNELFYPLSDFAVGAETYATITVTQAAEALENYLTTGQADWKKVLGL